MVDEGKAEAMIIKELGPYGKKSSPPNYFGLLQLLLLIVAMLFAGLANDTGNAATGSPEVRVGSELEFPPYAFVDKSGQPVGFSVDLIKAVGDAMGMSIKISTGPWDTVWNDLVAGRLDVLPIVAKSPERRRLVDFSLPHTETYDAFFVLKGNPQIQNIEAARGKEIVVMRSDAAHHALLERNFHGSLILVDTIPAGLALISSGMHDAFLCSKLIGTILIKEHGLKNLAAGPPIPDYKRVFSFAVKKGDAELLEKLNQGLLIIKTRGQYDRIYEKWLTADDPWRMLKKYLWPAIVIVIAIVLIAGFGLVMLQLLVKKRTRQLSESNEMLHLAQEGLEERVAERTAELKMANEELESFSYSVSHDLKTPVRAIQGFSRMLMEEHADKLDAEGLRLLKVISDNTRLMDHLIDDLLALSRLGRQHVRKSLIDITALTRQVFEKLRGQKPERDLRLTLDDLPPCLGDQSLLYQVLENLLANAIKFTKSRKTASIEVGGRTEGQENIYYFKDNGVGFDKNYAHKLFRPFQSLHHRKDYEGTGVGLAIIKRIVQKHGGRVWAEGKINEGATFYFALPKSEN